VKLLLKAINKNVPEVSTTFHDFNDCTMCNQEGEDCVLLKCEHCANVCVCEGKVLFE
jgi:hypothetical protein